MDKAKTETSEEGINAPKDWTEANNYFPQNSKAIYCEANAKPEAATSQAIPVYVQYHLNRLKIFLHSLKLLMKQLLQHYFRIKTVQY